MDLRRPTKQRCHAKQLLLKLQPSFLIHEFADSSFASVRRRTEPNEMQSAGARIRRIERVIQRQRIAAIEVQICTADFGDGITRRSVEHTRRRLVYDDVIERRRIRRRKRTLQRVPALRGRVVVAGLAGCERVPAPKQLALRRRDVDYEALTWILGVVPGARQQQIVCVIRDTTFPRLPDRAFMRCSPRCHVIGEV